MTLHNDCDGGQCVACHQDEVMLTVYPILSPIVARYPLNEVYVVTVVDTLVELGYTVEQIVAYVEMTGKLNARGVRQDG